MGEGGGHAELVGVGVRIRLLQLLNCIRPKQERRYSIDCTKPKCLMTLTLSKWNINLKIPYDSWAVEADTGQNPRAGRLKLMVGEAGVYIVHFDHFFSPLCEIIYYNPKRSF